MQVRLYRRGGCYNRGVTTLENQHRRSLRLRGYDYSQAGGYYLTIVTQGRECLFGEIVGNDMVLNEAGKMVAKWWNELPGKFPSVTADACVVMPNHFHGVVFIHDTTVGADLRVGPGDMGNQNVMGKGAHIGAPLQPMPRPDAPLSQIVQWFKTMTTNEYIRGVKGMNWQPFIGKLWQRNYYEHIIRNEEDYERIFNYIVTNPVNWGEDEENR